ncbi:MULTISPECIES: hypothetical protein [unclassified Roseivivax]|uniref:hypothetical protein n=1 Tax=Roseivivax sp. GX 12232 TaxID=2900547 RepID=UPI001E3365AD|nr:hypothetical protein [Roseivivax sp. GX 12232]MCE0505127.1 hypothetical protein [Roseivivax sp. GX 12232]
MTGNARALLGAVSALLILSACGGGGSSYSAPVVKFASGPIYSGCMASDRKARSRALCGCVQAMANDTLTGSDSRRAARFFRDPQEAHDVKYSKTARDDAFWDRYEAFVSRSERTCRGL